MSTFVSEGKPILLQTITTFEGRGIETPMSLGLAYTVPEERAAAMLYFRAGSTCGGMVNITILRDGRPMRYFPVAANSTMHVSLAIVEELPTGSRIEIVAAGEGSGSLILDIGFLEV